VRGRQVLLDRQVEGGQAIAELVGDPRVEAADLGRRQFGQVREDLRITPAV
jgi:hypothetical protein